MESFSWYQKTTYTLMRTLVIVMLYPFFYSGERMAIPCKVLPAKQLILDPFIQRFNFAQRLWMVGLAWI